MEVISLFCEHCGQRLEADSKFCVHCGTAIASEKRIVLVHAVTVRNNRRIWILALSLGLLCFFIYSLGWKFYSSHVAAIICDRSHIIDG
jgi:uncharacterized membrane protein YvbJ